MRPDAVEVLRGLQGALLGTVMPEVQSLFVQDTLQSSQMLLEMLANEWDSAADTLSRDNEALAEMLGRAGAAMRSLPGQDKEMQRLADDIVASVAAPAKVSLTISALTARNYQLRSLLERAVVACEDAVGEKGREALLALRAEMYGHLREVAIRGWSFWDALSFRERMARLRAGAATEPA